MPPHLHTAAHTPPVPSPLSHPVSPFSPLSPLFPLPSNMHLPHRPLPPSRTLSSSSAPTPDSPLPWLWTCHTCHTSYPLGATRRCLDDGHTFCAGVSSVRKRGRNGVRRERRRSRACGNEFDYTGWKAWSRWRRARDAGSSMGELGRAVEMAESDVPNIGHHSIGRGMKDEQSSAANFGDTTKAEKKKNCWQTCTYPSHCRWGKAVGIHTPSPSTATFSFERFPSGSDTHMADLPSLDPCCDNPSPANDSNQSSDAEMVIDPSILSQSSSFISLPSPLAQSLQANTYEGEECDVMKEVVSEPGEIALLRG